MLGQGKAPTPMLVCVWDDVHWGIYGSNATIILLRSPPVIANFWPVF